MTRGSLAAPMIRSGILAALLLGAWGASAYAADLGPEPLTPASSPEQASWWSSVKFDAMVEGGFTGNVAGPPNPPGNFGQLFTDKANMFLMNSALTHRASGRR